MPDPNDQRYLRNRPTRPRPQQQASSGFKFPSLQEMIQGATGGKRGLQTPQQAGATARQLNPLGAAYSVSTAGNLAARAVTPNLLQQSPVGQFGQGFLSGGQPPTDSGVNAGQGAGVVVPQTQPQGQPSLAQSPVEVTVPHGRDAYTPSLAQTARIQPGLEQTQFGAGTRQITPDSRTTYNLPGGYAEFQNALPGNVAARQGLPQGGQFSGAATNAEAAATLADYAARGLDHNGNDLSVANTLQAKADKMEQDRIARNERRLAFRAANTMDAQRNHALATLRRENPAAYAEAVLNAPQESAVTRLVGENQRTRLDQFGLQQEQQQFSTRQQNENERALLDYDAKLIKAAQDGKKDTNKLDPYDKAFTDAYQEAQKVNLNGFSDTPIDPYQAGVQARDAMLRQQGRIRGPDGQVASLAEVAQQVQSAAQSNGMSIQQYIEIMRQAGYSGPLELIAQISAQG